MNKIYLSLLIFLLLLNVSCTSDDHKLMSYIPEDSGIVAKFSINSLISSVVDSTYSAEIKRGIENQSKVKLEDLKNSGLDLEYAGYGFVCSKNFDLGILFNVSNIDSTRERISTDMKITLTKSDNYEYSIEGKNIVALNDKMLFIGNFSDSIADNNKLSILADYLKTPSKFEKECPTAFKALESDEDIVVYADGAGLKRCINKLSSTPYYSSIQYANLFLSEINDITLKMNINDKEMVLSSNINYVENASIPKIFAKITEKPSSDFLKLYKNRMDFIGAASINGKELSGLLASNNAYSMTQMMSPKLQEAIESINGTISFGYAQSENKFCITIASSNPQLVATCIAEISNGIGYSVEKDAQGYKYSNYGIEFDMKCEGNNVIIRSGTPENNISFDKSILKLFSEAPIALYLKPVDKISEAPTIETTIEIFSASKTTTKIVEIK